MEVASTEWKVVVRRRRSRLTSAHSCRQAALSTPLPSLGSVTTLTPFRYFHNDEASTRLMQTSSSHPNTFLNSFSSRKPWSGSLEKVASNEHCEEGKRLIMKMEKAMTNIESSVFFKRFSDQLQALKLLETLRPPTGSSEVAQDSISINKVTLTECGRRNLTEQTGRMTSSYKTPDDVSMEIVLYGVGSILLSEVSRNQFCLALLMRKCFFCAAKIFVFDPVLTPLEWKVIASLGCSMLIKNEKCRRMVRVPTIFYMPHCEVGLYDNILQANWRENHLCSLAILGNSFRIYQERWAISPNPQVARPNYVLQEQRYVEEYPVDACSFTVESAFNDMSWHLFPFELENKDSVSTSLSRGQPN